MPQPDKARGDRLTLRMHPDIMEILAARAAERGISRSHLVEQILVGFMRADPRNPKLDPVGRMVPGADSPGLLRERSPLQVAEKWQKFVTAHTILVGTPPPQDWLEDASGYWDAPSHAERGAMEEPSEESEAKPSQQGRWQRRRRKRD
ncbi:hypothetical protein JQ596_09175 [Bradyrhizobium manausense]|uniref:hypothetical protein n=1 Tax=Bradyrhizobium TaxID=374 RepID=UPI001BABA3AD|nr:MULTISPECIES: hypothetical protein [Bradyrhizobium]MBR0825709.1 hypothetical protein [Bradyrhizobium manausense]UVO31344.1 hypothetical protein KUF59_12175 [Bradyrhizobium arachidis]